MWIYRARKNKRMLKIFSALLCVLLAVVIVINLAVMKFLCDDQPVFYIENTADPETVVNETQVAREVTEQIEEEGLVLLRNEKNALPMTETKANVFGFASDAIIYGGSDPEQRMKAKMSI